MNFKKNILKLCILSVITFFIISNLYILIYTPITYKGGCSKEELETVEYIDKYLPENSYVFTDLRLSSILRTLTDVNVISAPGYPLSSFEELNTTYQVFYSNDSFKAYWSIKKLFQLWFIPQNKTYMLFSILYTSEGITTMDYSFGPISIETYNMYLNSSYFTLIFNNNKSFVVKINNY